MNVRDRITAYIGISTLDEKLNMCLVEETKSIKDDSGFKVLPLHIFIENLNARMEKNSNNGS